MVYGQLDFIQGVAWQIQHCTMTARSLFPWHNSRVKILFPKGKMHSFNEHPQPATHTVGLPDEENRTSCQCLLHLFWRVSDLWLNDNKLLWHKKQCFHSGSRCHNVISRKEKCSLAEIETRETCTLARPIPTYTSLNNALSHSSSCVVSLASDDSGCSEGLLKDAKIIHLKVEKSRILCYSNFQYHSSYLYPVYI